MQQSGNQSRRAGDAVPPNSDLLNRLGEALNARYVAGYQAGYDAALGDMLEFLKRAGDEPIPPSAMPFLTEPEPESAPIAEPESAPVSALADAPYLQRAMRYLADNPGATAHHAVPHIGNKNAFYRLVKLGLVEKRGSQFYPVER